MLAKEDHKWSKSCFQRKTMTHKIATKRVSNCVDSHRYRMQKSIFIELFFLALFLMPWQKAYSQELFFLFLTWNEVDREFWQERKTGHETHEIKFFFSLDTYP